MRGVSHMSCSQHVPQCGVNPKLRGLGFRVWGGSHNRDNNMLRSILGPCYFGNIINGHGLLLRNA